MTNETTRDDIRALANAASEEADAKYAEGWDEPDTEAACPLCGDAPAEVEARMPDDAGDPQPALVCRACYEYGTGASAEEHAAFAADEARERAKERTRWEVRP